MGASSSFKLLHKNFFFSSNVFYRMSSCVTDLRAAVQGFVMFCHLKLLSSVFLALSNVVSSGLFFVVVFFGFYSSHFCYDLQILRSSFPDIDAPIGKPPWADSEICSEYMFTVGIHFF